jgi:hypothetical protein
MNVLGFSVPTHIVGIIVLAVVLLVAAIAALIIFKKRPRRLNKQYYKKRWQEAQGLCKNQGTWPLAVINADKLLDEALKKRKYKGKTMGERLVSAQHQIRNNDHVWFGHKLRNKLVHEEFTKLKKKDVLEALVGFREALKDLGALD